MSVKLLYAAAKLLCDILSYIPARSLGIFNRLKVTKAKLISIGSPAVNAIAAANFFSYVFTHGVAYFELMKLGRRQPSKQAVYVPRFAVLMKLGDEYIVYLYVEFLLLICDELTQLRRESFKVCSVVFFRVKSTCEKQVPGIAGRKLIYLCFAPRNALTELFIIYCTSCPSFLIGNI